MLVLDGSRIESLTFKDDRTVIIMMGRIQTIYVLSPGDKFRIRAGADAVANCVVGKGFVEYEWTTATLKADPMFQEYPLCAISENMVLKDIRRVLKDGVA